MRSKFLITANILVIAMFGQLRCPYLNVMGDTVYPSTPYDKFFGIRYVKPELYDSLPEQEVATAKRLIKSIDFSDKTNAALFNTINLKEGIVPLFEIMKIGVTNNIIKAFPVDIYGRPLARFYSCDSFLMRVTIADSVTETIVDENGNEKQQAVFRNEEIKYHEIKSIQIDEVWYFNKKYSRLEKRIIGMAPVRKNPKTNIDEPLFWVYYNEARDFFAGYAVKCSATTGQWKTYEELFRLRFFNAYIEKEFNVFERRKLDNGKALDDLLESEMAKEKILKSEEDKWSH